MGKVRVLHAADLHLDTAFDGLPDALAARRRAELREIPEKLVPLAERVGAQVVLLPGDLFDGRAGAEAIEAVERMLQALQVPVFIAPGNHDFYRPGCVYDKMYLPEHVHVFRENQIKCVPVPELDLRVWGGAFTDSVCRPLLAEFRPPEKHPDTVDLLCVHGVVAAVGPYNPITPEQLAALLRQSANTTPNPAALSAVGATFNKEDSDNEDVFVASPTGRVCIAMNLGIALKGNQRFVAPRGLGSMGYALPSSIGACIASGYRRTICFEGDGSLQHNIQELQLIKRQHN